MSNSILALFPGQGSQKVGMGRELIAQSPEAAKLFAKADEALGFSLTKICFEGPEEELTRTAVAQPAILTVSVVSFQLSGLAPHVRAAAGHSLGEYSALVAAGAIQFEDAVLLVHKRGTYMQEAVPAGTGKMVAVLGKELADIESACGKVTSGVAEIANINAPGQVVVAGDVSGIAGFIEALGTAKCVPLNVSAPFHCSLMQPAAQRLATDLRSLAITTPRFPVYANAVAAPLSDPDTIRQALIDQVCGRVRWVESMERAIREVTPSHAVEFGMGNTLAGLMKRINSSVPRVSVYTPMDAATLST